MTEPISLFYTQISIVSYTIRHLLVHVLGDACVAQEILNILSRATRACCRIGLFSRIDFSGLFHYSNVSCSLQVAV